MTYFNYDKLIDSLGKVIIDDPFLRKYIKIDISKVSPILSNKVIAYHQNYLIFLKYRERFRSNPDDGEFKETYHYIVRTMIIDSELLRKMIIKSDTHYWEELFSAFGTAQAVIIKDLIGDKPYSINSKKNYVLENPEISDLEFFEKLAKKLTRKVIE